MEKKNAIFDLSKLKSFVGVHDSLVIMIIGIMSATMHGKYELQKKKITLTLNQHTLSLSLSL